MHLEKKKNLNEGNAFLSNKIYSKITQKMPCQSLSNTKPTKKDTRTKFKGVLSRYKCLAEHTKMEKHWFLLCNSETQASYNSPSLL